ncbi:MAG TPA: translesion DNA synthesis-associated protein ImuA [Ramlibacter sp.]|nr:translesion DNA synthesis-associated protein ImuA [Ramlibacter sp.]
MSLSSSLRPVDPISLPYVWRVEDLAAEQAVIPTGHPLLDAQLPGGGWPVGSMIEILQSRPAQHVWQLLLPGLARSLSLHAGPVILIGAPHEPFAPSLRARGVPGERLLWVKSDKESARLWAAEQALRCAQAAAVLAWVPQARSDALRRLHLAAQQQGRLLFVFRGLQARQSASPARLRLGVEGVDTLELRIFKRRGPPLEEALHLAPHSERLAALLEARKRRASTAWVPSKAPPLPERSHVLDRTAAFT